MTHICAEAHFPHILFKPCINSQTSDFQRSEHSWTCQFNLPVFPSFLVSGRSGISFMVTWSGDWQFGPFQEAQSEVAPWHWHDHGNRWKYSIPMVWPPFPGPLWGTCVSASGIWVRWSVIFIQIVARKNLHPFGIKIRFFLGISLIIYTFFFFFFVMTCTCSCLPSLTLTTFCCRLIKLSVQFLSILDF